MNKEVNSLVQILTDVGNFRKVNEDYIDYYTDETKRIYVIADGMGGHNAGEIASKLAVENTISYINSLSQLDDLEDSIRKAVGDSNNKIYELSKSKADSVSYTHLRAHETDSYLVCRL